MTAALLAASFISDPDTQLAVAIAGETKRWLALEILDEMDAL